jgi:hypothetical protein
MRCSKTAAPAAASTPDGVVRVEAFCTYTPCTIIIMLLLLLLLLLLVVAVPCLLTGAALALGCCTTACSAAQLCTVGMVAEWLLLHGSSPCCVPLLQQQWHHWGML